LMKRTCTKRAKGSRSRHRVRAMKILCLRCHVGRIDHERCDRCGYRPSRSQEEQARAGRLVRDSLIGLVALLAVVWLVSVL